MGKWFRGVVPQGCKYCYKCKTVKLQSDFHPHRKRYDGLKNLCKTCSRIVMRQYRVRALQRVFGSEVLCCPICSCDILGLLEIHHKNGGGCKDREYVGGDTKLTVRIANGLRKTDDLEVICKICHKVKEAREKFGVAYAIKYIGVVT